MPRLDPTLRHATTAPAFDPTKIHRERLVDLLHSHLPKKLIVVAAPAGYGKTTLLADFTAHSEFPVFWVRLTPADHDERRLADLVVATVRRRFRRVMGQKGLTALVGATAEALGRALGEAMGAVGEPFVLVLDDVHHLNPSPSALAMLDAMLESMPEDSSLIASGREVIEVSLARLMAEENLAGLGPQDLSLNEEELRSLAKQRGSGDLSDREFRRILEETRGWLAGILLSGILQGRRSAGPIDPNRPLVHDYLASVVLNRQPDALRAFLLEASVLPYMTADACDQALERSDSGRILTRLAREGIFVTASVETPRSYEFHPQFRDFLLATLEESAPARLRRVRVRAARYAEKAGQVEQAVALYLDGGQARRALRLAERHAKEMFDLARVRTLETWTDRLARAGAEAPVALRYLAVAYADLGQIASAETCLDRARRAVEQGGASPEVEALLENAAALVAYYQGDYPAVEARAARAAELARSLRHPGIQAHALYLRASALAALPGTLPRAADLVEQALDLLRGGDDHLLYADGLRLQASIHVARGEISRASAASMEAYRLVREEAPALSLCSHLNNLAATSYLLGDYDTAIQYYSQALREARLVGSDLREALILYGMGDVYNDVGLAIQAAELYGEGLSVATRVDSTPWIVYGCVRTAALYRRRRLPEVAREWLKRARYLSKDSEGRDALTVEEAFAAGHARPEDARRSLERLLAQPEAEVESAVRAAAWVARARLTVTAGDLDGAREALRAALQWAGPRQQEQVLAAELLHDEELRNLATRLLGDHPVMGVVLNRVEALRAFERMYISEPAAEEAPLTRLEVRALGGWQVVLAGEELRSTKPQLRELLLYLVDRGPVARDVLGEVFWPNSPPGKRQASIHMGIHSLRRWLGTEAVELDGAGYRLSDGLELTYDVESFVRAREIALALPRGDPRRYFALTEAVNSYAGAFAPDADSEWAADRRNELEVKYLEVLSAYGEEALTRDFPQRAVELIRRGLAIDPYRDDLNAHYMEALGRLGRRSEVVAHYQRYKDLLDTELGLDPPKDVRELYARLMR